ncbi:MAG: beta 1-4 rhamnosyltransferase Cps2T [Lachnospiraceae bacterium]
MKKNIQHVFLVGAKSLGAYGGYETFINKLTEYHQNNSNIKYHVACKANGDGCMKEDALDGVIPLDSPEFFAQGEFLYHNAHCFKIHVPNIGPAQAIYYDIKALDYCVKYIKKKRLEHAIIYVMACRIGPFFKKYVKAVHKLGGKVFLNPDGHEWMRAKWSKPIRMYWKLSEQMMVKMSDRIICDSVNIEKYIQTSYQSYRPNTTYIAYGAETRACVGADERYEKWLQEKGIQDEKYYLVVGRFVPENNYEIMIREFMSSNTEKDFVIITNVSEKFLDTLEKRLHFQSDKRIKFVGTVYDQELLMKIRQQAFGYFHGHEVGGTNPSLLEALGSTKLNLLLDVSFNKEVAKDAALYWSKEEGSLSALIEKADAMTVEERNSFEKKAKSRIKDAYSWQFICDCYEQEWLN